MSDIKTVAVVGATGLLGKPITAALVAAGFTVTAIQRSSSAADPPPGVAAARKVDYGSVADLTAALAGQDAVVSVVAGAAVGSQTALAEAAVAAGVRRFVPSEFGINTRITPGTAVGKVVAAKVALVDLLARKAEENPGFSWTAVSTGYFFDKGLEGSWFGFDARTRTAKIFDSGAEPFQTSTLSYIGKAVAAVLSRPAATANRYLFVSSFRPLATQNTILSIAEELTGAKWTVERLDTAGLQRLGEEKLAKGEFGPAFAVLLNRWLFADGEGRSPKEGEYADAELGLAAEDLRAVVRKWLEDAGAI